MNEARNEPLYAEWVLPNWSSFLPVLAIYPTFWLTFLPIDLTLGTWLGVGCTLLAVALMLAKAARISVTIEQLQVANASIDREFISSVEAIYGQDSFAERGRNLDTRAWIHFQGSVKSLVKVTINDPSDPTPYWLFSTRRPEELKIALGF
jgi:hypothetical protein